MLRGVTPVAGLSRGRPVGARATLAWTAAALALAAAVGGALLGDGGVAGPTLAVATASGRATAFLQGVGDRLPLGYAFGAGMAAACNPCGFALLPAYLGFSLRAGGGPHPVGRPVARALVVGGAMTAGFVALFGAAGLVLGTVVAAVAGLLPWASALVGVVLVLAGGRMLAGGTVRAPGVEPLGAWFGGPARRADVAGHAAYGAAFALSSLGCTLPLFLTVVGTALTAGGLRAAVGQFLLYALGMGAVVTVATVLVALFGRELVARAGVVGRYVQTAGAALLVVTGAYVVYYWLTVGGLLV